MGVTEEVPNVLGKTADWFLDKRGALTVTRSHLKQMREVVDTALQAKWWPPGAPAERWETAWSRHGSVLARRINGDTYVLVDDVYGYAENFRRGLAPGERPFDATAQHPGDDERFFRRYLDALDRADAALTANRPG